MPTSFEDKLKIIPISEALEVFRIRYPESDFFKVQIEPEGPYIKYEMVGNDDAFKNTLEINAHTGDEIKDKQKPIKEKRISKNAKIRASKALNLDELMPLSEINDLAQKQVEDAVPFQWELDRAGERTVWKIEYASELGTEIREIKIDAHDGTIIQMKLKN